MISQINARRVFVVPVDDDDVVLHLTVRYGAVCVSNDRYTQDIYRPTPTRPVLPIHVRARWPIRAALKAL